MRKQIKSAINQQSFHSDNKDRNFHRQVIMSNIYDLENIRLIRQNQYKKNRQNKVHEQKKKKYSQQVARILKEVKQVEMKPSRFTQTNKFNRSLQKFNKSRPLSACQIYQSPLISNQIQPESDLYYLEIDQDIGQLGRNIDEQHSSFKEKVQNLMEKVKEKGAHHKTNKIMQNIQVYLHSLFTSPENRGRIHVKVDQKIEGYLAELKKIEKQGKNNIIKVLSSRRKIQKKQPQKRLLTNLSSTRAKTKRVCSAVYLPNKSQIKLKSTAIIEQITKIQNQSSKSKKFLVKKLDCMEKSWKKQNIQVNKSINQLRINSETLELLKKQRLKEQAMIENDLKILE